MAPALNGSEQATPHGPRTSPFYNSHSIPIPGNRRRCLNPTTRTSRSTRRVLLKMSGEAFGHGGTERHQHRRDARTSPGRSSDVVEAGVQLAIVVGGGNILRGAQFSAGGEVIKEATAHYMGMLATVHERPGPAGGAGEPGRADAAADGHAHGERRRAVHPPPGHPPPGKGPHRHPGRRHRQPVRDDRHRRRPARQRAGGRTSCSRRRESTASTRDDPEKNPHAVRYDRLTYDQVFRDKLRVMDMSAIEMCEKGKLPILVFNYKKEGNIERAIAGHPIGTLVSE